VRVLEEAVRTTTEVIGWRDVRSTEGLGHRRSTMPVLRQSSSGACARAGFERKLFMIRKRSSRRPPSGLGASTSRACRRERSSTRLSLPERLDSFYLDLRKRDEEQVRARPLALQHNTFPRGSARTVPAHRHNGEINTLRGNQT